MVSLQLSWLTYAAGMRNNLNVPMQVQGVIGNFYRLVCRVQPDCSRLLWVVMPVGQVFFIAFQGLNTPKREHKAARDMNKAGTCA